MPASAYVLPLLVTAMQAPTPSGPPPSGPMQSGPLAVVPIRPGLHVITGAGGNTVVRSTADGILIVDAKSSGDMVFAALNREIRAISPAPIRYLVNTHYHGDHSGNDARFQSAGAVTVAQEGIRRELANFVPPPFNPSEKPAPLPQMLYRDATILRLGKTQVSLRYFGPGHTGSDSLVLFPDLKVLALGDQLAAAPLLDYAGGASLPGWIDSLDRALKLDWTIAIPGHGAPTDRAAVIAFRGKLQILLDRARAAVANGATRDTLFEAIRHDDLFPMQPGFWTMPAQRHGLFADAQSRARPK